MIELIGLLKKPDRDVDELVSVMSHDPSLTAEILRRCNSAVFGGDQPATDIFEATFRLGFHEVYRIATALFGSRALNWSGAKGGTKLSSLWEHSAWTAVSAGSLAKELEEGEGIAFTAGLLHDVGKVVLASAEGSKYAQLIESAPSEESLGDSEMQLFGFEHSKVGARLLTRWGLPMEIVTPVEFHHCPEKASANERLTAILHLADWAAYGIGQGTLDQLLPTQSMEHSRQVLDLDSERLSSILKRIEQDTDKVRQLFQIKRG